MQPSLHQHTPSLTAFDPRGLNIRHVDYYRQRTQDTPQSRVSRCVFNRRGALKEQWDPRLSALRDSDESVRPNQRLCDSLSGRQLLSDSVDTGRLITWFGSAGQVVERWDARGACESFEYDQLLRLSRIFEQSSEQGIRTRVEQFTYGTTTSSEAARNSCGRLINHVDPAGQLLFGAYNLLGQLSTQTRRFADELPDSAGHTSTWRYQALGQLIEQTDAKGNSQHFQHAQDGLLSRIGVTFNDGSHRTLLEQRLYSASGQVISERAGNGVLSMLEYNAVDERLQRSRGYRSGKLDEPLQDLAYSYDRVGNVLTVSDTAQPIQWFDNTRTEAQNTYRYDSLYRLIEATGRESVRSVTGPNIPEAVAFSATQGALCRNYRQRYSYDASGNLSSLQHMPERATGYTRQMNIAIQSNHSVQQTLGVTAVGLGMGFDLNGNQLMLEPGQTLSWNARNQLQRVTHVVRAEGMDDDEMYLYDGSGQRAVKIRRSHAKNQVHSSEVRYLPGLEIRRNSATGEWLNTLIVASELSSIRVLQWEQGRPEGIENQQLRLGLTDHLGNNSLELDGDARVISQETYYPYGGTAWWAAKSAVEASYKTIRHSGKERDASGLYYYGHRYYAPWLSRWISADPAGDIDGLNLYAMARGNPTTHADSQGLATVADKGSRFSRLRGFATRIAQRIRPVLQAASSAAIRDSLATYTSNAVGVGVDLLLFASRQPTRTLNHLLRQTVAALDALSVLHITVGFVGNWTRWSPFLGFIASVAADRGFAVQGQDEALDLEHEWDAVARTRLIGHVRAFSREVSQQVVRGLGTSVSWGQGSLGARVPRTLMAAGAYGLATIPNTMLSSLIPGPLIPNVGPFIEGYDGAAGTAIRAGHATSVYESHVDAIQLPDLAGTGHGGLSRMFNQVWSYWAGIGIESIARYATGVSAAAQSSRTRSWVAAARGFVSAFTELRGLVVLKAREGYSNYARRWMSAQR